MGTAAENNASQPAVPAATPASATSPGPCSPPPAEEPTGAEAAAGAEVPTGADLSTSPTPEHTHVALTHRGERRDLSCTVCGSFSSVIPEKLAETLARFDEAHSHAGPNEGRWWKDHPPAGLPFTLDPRPARPEQQEAEEVADYGSYVSSSIDQRRIARDDARDDTRGAHRNRRDQERQNTQRDRDEPAVG